MLWIPPHINRVTGSEPDHRQSDSRHYSWISEIFWHLLDIQVKDWMSGNYNYVNLLQKLNFLNCYCCYCGFCSSDCMYLKHITHKCMFYYVESIFPIPFSWRKAHSVPPLDLDLEQTIYTFSIACWEMFASGFSDRTLLSGSNCTHDCPSVRNFPTTCMPRPGHSK